MTKRVLPLVMILIFLISLSAHAETSAGTVRATGDVYLRSGPGLGYEKLTAVKKGTTLTFVGDTSVDERGVEWYRVNYRDYSDVWVSSRYSELTRSAESSGYAGTQSDPYQNANSDLNVSPVLPTSPSVPAASVNAADAAALQSQVEAVAGQVKWFFPGDYDGNGTIEAFALVGQSDLGARELWYSNGTSARKIDTTRGMGFEQSSTSYHTSSGMIFCCVDGYTSTSLSQIWYVANGQPIAAPSTGLGWVDQYGASDFAFTSDAFDAFTDGTGHTWKKYYAYWDGTSFTEYGGITLSIDQLYGVQGAARWIDEILSSYRITGIYYRANGIVNINYTDGTTNFNATLQLTGGAAQLVRAGDFGAAETLSESDYGGVYDSHVLSRVTYPDSFAYEQTAQAQPQPQPNESAQRYARDLDGDGRAETVAVYEKNGWDDVYMEPALGCFLGVWDADGNSLGEVELRDLTTLQGAEYEVMAYAMGNGRIYIEAYLYWDNVAVDYMILRLDNGGIDKEYHIENPGYTDAAGLRDAFTYRDLFYSDNLGDASAVNFMPVLNDAFAAYNIRFVPDGYDWYKVDLPEESFIFTVNYFVND